MCGIAGCIETTDRRAPVLRHHAERMANAIAHRGPDDNGVWVSEALGVALGHRRLAIIDPSPRGHQPMSSPSGRYVMAFNGEIYNYRELRDRLDGQQSPPAWRGDSDTEIFLAACDAWGVTEALQASNGMFAIALVDLQTRKLILARDRMGEKPLYYGVQGKSFLFGSELRALRQHPHFVGAVDEEALTPYFRFGYVPTPLSIYTGIRKLEPAHMIEIECGADTFSVGAAQPFWRLPIPAPRKGRSEAEAIEQLEGLLLDAVRIRMHADVPLGAFLSGGVDSSTVVAMMQSQSSRPVCTYSIGFEERDYDESDHARAVARALGTTHTELRVRAQDAMEMVPRLPEIYDEPFADSSQIPTCILARLTREHVTVALSGDAGDEIFGGYNRYTQGRRLLGFYSLVPRFGRRVIAGALRSVPAGPIDLLLGFAPRGVAVLLGSDRLYKLADVIDKDGIRDLYKRLVSQWAEPGALRSGRHEGTTVIDDERILETIESPVDWMMYVDQRTYLPDDILVKVDRASMSVALEGRIPFLDHRVVEFAARLPMDVKLRGGTGKWILRQVLYKYLDRRLFERPKQGFGIPLAAWLRGPLRAWAEELLSEKALRETGVIDVRIARDAWAAHLSRARNLHYPLWTLLMFQAWVRAYQAPLGA